MSAVVAAGVGALVALLIGQGAKSVQQKIDQKTGDTILSVTQPDGTVQNVQLKNNAVISPQYDFIRLTTSQTTKSDDNAPNYELKNDSSVIKRIFSISFVPDGNFKAGGILALSLNDTQFFPITNLNAGDFQDVDSITIPIPDTYGLKILPKRKLKAFIWSPNGSTVSGTLAIFIGELP